MSNFSITETDKAYVAGTYNRFPVEIVSAKGSVLTDGNGKRYIDMGSGIGVTAFGNGDADWKASVIEQLNLVQHTSNLYYTAPCAKLAKMLCEKTGMSKVFFSNSGAEANECAIKIARKYAADNKGPEYSTIITLKNSFHGRTLTTLAATGQEHYHELFRPLTPGFVHVENGNVEELEEAVKNNKVAGIMIECIQGEGGVIPIDAEYAKKVQEIADRENIVLVVDEVQTGNGRTGKLYAYMNFGLKPDVVSTAKGLAGGLPLGATMMSEKVSTVLGIGDHGSTFGGNPVCCAGAISILNRIDDSLLAEVRDKSNYVFASLKGQPGIEAVTGLGLMIGIKTEKPAADVVKRLIDKGVLALTAKDKVRLLPALNIPMSLLKEAVEIIKAVAVE